MEEIEYKSTRPQPTRHTDEIKQKGKRLLQSIFFNLDSSPWNLQ